MSDSMNLGRPEMPREITLSLQEVADWLWFRLLETHLKPSWEKRAQEVERHQAEKARLMQIIDGLQEALHVYDEERERRLNEKEWGSNETGL